MTTPIASLSLDLDNRWSYLRANGDDSWKQRPTYLPEVVPQILEFLAERQLRCTFFVVGEDLLDDKNCDAVRQIAEAGHEVANHSQSHLTWLHSLPPEEQESQIADAELAIEQVTGTKPIGFRAPGFSWSPELLALLVRRGYAYDASVFPTFIGPLARVYCKFKGIGAKQEDPNSEGPPPQRFSSLSDALRTLRPHKLETADGPIVELPVTTMPLCRAPIHFTYIAFLAQKSPALARAYWNNASRLCRLRNVGPSLLLHPPDFLGKEDVPEMAFLPGMQLDRPTKLELLSDTLERLAKRRQVVTTAEHAATIAI